MDKEEFMNRIRMGYGLSEYLEDNITSEQLTESRNEDVVIGPDYKEKRSTKEVLSEWYKKSFKK